jgi:hypothetical protein
VLAAAVLVVGALALTLDGTAPLANATYGKHVSSALGRVAATTARPTDGSSADISRSLRRTKRAVDTAASTLAALAPPDGARVMHRRLVADLHEYARQLDLVRASVDFGDMATIAVHLQAMTAPAQIARDTAALNAAGFDVSEGA